METWWRTYEPIVQLLAVIGVSLSVAKIFITRSVSKVLDLPDQMANLNALGEAAQKDLSELKPMVHSHDRSIAALEALHFSECGDCPVNKNRGRKTRPQ